jgi:hypothetical protein
MRSMGTFPCKVQGSATFGRREVAKPSVEDEAGVAPHWKAQWCIAHGVHDMPSTKMAQMPTCMPSALCEGTTY